MDVDSIQNIQNVKSSNNITTNVNNFNLSPYIPNAISLNSHITDNIENENGNGYFNVDINANDEKRKINKS